MARVDTMLWIHIDFYTALNIPQYLELLETEWDQIMNWLKA